MRTKICLLALCLLIGSLQLSAQEMTHGYSHWYTYFGTAQLNKKWAIAYDFQARIRDGISTKGQFLNRAGLQYTPGKHTSYLLGYSFITTYSDAADQYFPEHRIYQQFIYKHGSTAYNMTHRVRFEERWVGQKTLAEKDVQYWKYGHRLRYFNRTIFPIGKSPWYFAVQDEFFMNVFNSEINKKFVDQNRFLATPGYAVRPNLKLEAGYMNHFVQTASGSKSMTHILHLAAFHNFQL